MALILGTDNITNKTVAKYQAQIKGLEEGKALLYPVNLKIKGGGFHTITAAVIRAPDDENGQPRYNLVIGNVGLGLNNHQFQQVTSKVMPNGEPDVYTYPYILEGMSLDQLTDETFLRGFIAQSSCAVDNDTRASQFYGFLNNYAKDKGNINLINNDAALDIDRAQLREKGRHIQKAGTRILKSPSSALKFALPTEVYKRVMFKYKLHNWAELNQAQAGKWFANKTIDRLHSHAFDKLQARINKQAKIENTTPEQIFDKYFSPEQKQAYEAYKNKLEEHRAAGKKLGFEF